MYLNARVAVLGGTIDNRTTTGRSAYTKLTHYSSKSKELSEIRKLRVVKTLMHEGEQIEVHMKLYVETVMSSEYFDKVKLL